MKSSAGARYLSIRMVEISGQIHGIFRNAPALFKALKAFRASAKRMPAVSGSL